ncbi:hypothetical protein Tco_1348620, partial [Tanacetum coccineum]
MVDELISTRIGYATRTALQSYTQDFEKKAQEDRKLYIEILPKEVPDFATPVIQSTITKSLENVVLAKSSSQPQSTYEAAASLTKFELKKILIDKLDKSKSYRAAIEHKNLYNALIQSYQLDKDLFDSYSKVYCLKRSHEDKDKDEDPSARPDQGLKKRKKSKDVEPLRSSKSKDSQSSSFKGTKSQSKSSGKSAQSEEPVFETTDTEMPQDQGDDMGNTEDQPNVKTASKHDWFKKPERPPTPDPNWNVGKQIDFRPPQTWISQIAKAEKPPLSFNELMSTPIDFSTNLEGHQYPFDLSKPLPLIEVQGRQVVHANYLINNNLEYLKGRSLSRKCTTSTTKTKVAKYDTIEGIEDMARILWSSVKKKISNLERDVIFDLNVALRIFTRSIVILKRVEDLQLGVEIYQKKLNITKPETFRFGISKLTLYTAYKNPQGIIYRDKLKRNRLMRSDELYKFCDSILTSVRSVLHDIASSLEMEYLPKRTWSELDRKRSCIIIKAIDQQLFKRRLMRNLEKFVRGREYGFVILCP